MTRYRTTARILTGLALCSSLALSGCAHGLAEWIVQTRDRQGALSLESQHYSEAAHSFHLALQIDPNDTTARDGFIEAQAGLAETLYQSSEFAEALAALEQARQVNPQSVRVASLTADITTARVKSEIVRSNYAEYKKKLDNLMLGYVALKLPEAEVAKNLKRFSYSYDTSDLSRAIRASSDLDAEVVKQTTLLIRLRTLVAAGAASSENSGAQSTGSGSGNSLLPLP